MTDVDSLTEEQRAHLTEVINAATEAARKLLPDNAGVALAISGLVAPGSVTYTTNMAWQQVSVLLRQCALAAESTHLHAISSAVSDQVKSESAAYSTKLLREAVEQKLSMAACIFGALRFAVLLIESSGASPEIVTRCQQLADEAFFLVGMKAVDSLQNQSVASLLTPAPDTIPVANVPDAAAVN